jgi:glucan biosynthesis protein C
MQQSCLTPEPQRRLYYLDGLRGLLMVMGIFLHASLIYSPQSKWLLRDTHTSVFLAGIEPVIHAFRMPCFFIISGLLTAVVLERKGATNFIYSRVLRLSLPIASTALLLNSVQAMLLAFHYGRPFWQYFSGTGWVSHLWFVIDLLLYTLGFTVLWHYRSRFCTDRLIVLTQLGEGIILVMPLLSLGLKVLGYSVLCSSGSMIGGFLDANELLHYSIFFVFGAVYKPGMNSETANRIAVWSFLLLLLAIVASVLSSHRIVQIGVTHSIEWASSLLCLWLGRILLNRPSKALRYLADASYTIYLFHHLVVIVLGLFLLPMPIAPEVKFLVVVAATATINIFIHRYIIQRLWWLELLFNGKLPLSSAIHKTTSSFRRSFRAAKIIDPPGML